MDEMSLIREDKLQNYLLVEGKDDEHVLNSLLEHYHIPQRFKIKNKEGILNLLDTLKTELKGSGPRRIGIVVDADTNLAARWDALRGRLIDFGYTTIPTMPDDSGSIIIENELPVVGLWLMPDNRVSGMLEDFIGLLVTPQDLLWPIAGDTLQKVIERDCRFSLHHKSKALVHTWLAWQKEPGKPLGAAVTAATAAHHLDATAPQAQQLMTWLRLLFDLDAV